VADNEDVPTVEELVVFVPELLLPLLVPCVVGFCCTVVVEFDVDNKTECASVVRGIVAGVSFPVRTIERSRDRGGKDDTVDIGEDGLTEEELALVVLLLLVVGLGELVEFGELTFVVVANDDDDDDVDGCEDEEVVLDSFPLVLDTVFVESSTIAILIP
jgi:hypothetical protein